MLPTAFQVHSPNDRRVMHKSNWNSCTILNFHYTSNQIVAPQKKPKGDHDGLKLLFGATIWLLVLRKRTQLTTVHRQLLVESAQHSFRAEDPFAVNTRFFIIDSSAVKAAR